MNLKGLIIIIVVGFIIASGIGFVPATLKTVWSKALAGGNSGKPDVEKVWHTETLAVKVPSFLNANTEGGYITVKSHDRDEIIVRIYVRKGREYLTDKDLPVDVTVSESENGLEITAKSERSGFFRRSTSLAVSYDILVPRQTEVRARTSGGPVSASGIDHNVTLVTSGGPVTVEEISGDVLARTSGGPITARQITGSLTARTSGGGISISDVTGKVNARTSGGPISILSVSGSVEARTSGGSITADVRALTEHLSLATSGGSISAQLPRNQGLNITARGGSIQNNLDDLAGDFKSRSLMGSVGDGGIPVNLRTSGGSVRISYRD